MVLGQHFFNRTTDVTQTFGIEKYIPYPLYSVFNPSDHDLGEARGTLGAGGLGMCARCTPGTRARKEAGVGPRQAWESSDRGRRGGEGGQGRRDTGEGRVEGEGQGPGQQGCRCGRAASAWQEEALGGRSGPSWVSQATAPLPRRAALQCDSVATLRPSHFLPQADLWPLSRPVLIRLKKKGDRCAVRSQFVQPICLPEPGSAFPAGHKCQIAGWGHQDESE